MKFSSILKKINFKSRKSMLKTGAIFFWTDMKRLFNWNIDNFKSNFLSRGQLGSKSNDKFFLSVLKMWQCCKYFFGNLIFALTARTLSGNRLKLPGLHGSWVQFQLTRVQRYFDSLGQGRASLVTRKIKCSLGLFFYFATRSWSTHRAPSDTSQWLIGLTRPK